jgi:hypothetical protein
VSGLTRLGRRRTLLLVSAVLLGLVGAVVLGLGLTGGPVPVRATALAAVPTTSGGVAPSGAVAASTSASPTTPVARYTPSSSVHLVIPSVGVDLPLLALTPKDGVIDPPLLTAGYWIAPYGGPVAEPRKATNTLYIAAHSAGRGHDGFDPLLATAEGGSSLAAGAVVEVRTPDGTARYTVDGSRLIEKADLPKDRDVWTATPGRLVLITCFQRHDARLADQNLVVFAHA